MGNSREAFSVGINCFTKYCGASGDAGLTDWCMKLQMKAVKLTKWLTGVCEGENKSCCIYTNSPYKDKRNAVWYEVAQTERKWSVVYLHNVC